MSQVVEPGPGTFLVAEDEEGLVLLKREERGWLTWRGTSFFPLPLPWSQVAADEIRLATVTDLMKVGHPVQF